jgi:hypothetical protein
LYDEARNEIQITRHDLLKNSKNQNVSLATQSILKRVEVERDNAICDLRRLAADNDSLKDRLRVNLNKFLIS